MPNLESAKKAMRVSKKKRVINDRRRKALKSSVKASKAAPKDAKALSLAYQAIDKAAQRGVIKKGAAARKKSRLMKALKKLS
jgi:small subunit ribosomal protein S20